MKKNALAANNKNQVTTKIDENKVVASAVMDFAADAGAGLEGADAGSFAIPFLAVLQGLSPQLETVEGAKPGLLLNTITNEVFRDVQVIPCAFQRRYLRWSPNRGGYKGDLNPIDVETGKVPGAVRGTDGRYTLEGDELQDTRNHFVLAQSASGAWQPALMSLSRTQLKKSKRWMSRIQGVELRTAEGKPFNPPSYSHVYRIASVKEENEKGSWYGLDITLVGSVTDPETYARAKAFNKQVSAGQVRAGEPVGLQDETF